MADNKILTGVEYMSLLIVEQLGDAFLEPIYKAYEATGKSTSSNCIYYALKGILSKGYISSYRARLPNRQSGPSNVCFKIEQPGIDALRDFEQCVAKIKNT